MRHLLKSFIENAPKPAPKTAPNTVVDLWPTPLKVSQFNQHKRLVMTREECYKLEQAHAALLVSLHTTKLALEAMGECPNIDCKELKIAYYSIGGLVYFAENLIDQELRNRQALRVVAKL